MGSNYYFKDVTTEKFLLYQISSGEEHIYGDYSDLKSLSAALTWIAKYKSHYAGSKFKIRKVVISVGDIKTTEDEDKYINEIIIKKNIDVI